ncbi:MAG: sodium:solute symporter family protein [Acidobacteria bacterium]|nr:sodium:solute symporter family protein [Acidobacteriota bacterium]
MQLHTIDYAIIGLYFVFVLGIGVALKRFMRTSLDFFLSGRSLATWITALAFISANLGAQEVIGMAASGAKYGILTSHFYWVGAIPAMIFVGVFMMPFYYGSRARSVPEYLRLRFDEKTRGLNAISFAVMTIFSSGISMYAMGLLFQQFLGWDMNYSIIIAAAIVLVYTFLGGLTSSIYNEVLQFFLIVFGFLPLSLLGLKAVGWWPGLQAKLAGVATARGFEPGVLTESWKHLGSASANPMGVEWFGMVMGLGFVLSFGYWCTDFLVVQRAMAAKSMNAARRTPIVAAIPKMVFPFLVILPGMVILALVGDAGLVDAGGKADYNRALPLLLGRLYPSGLLGLGLAALLASFMSGMAGNVTAFNTVWTYDIYQSYIRPGADDRHYLWMGRMATVFGTLASIATAYIAMMFNNIMDLLQLVFSFINAPLFATFLLGMFWARATPNGAFWGLLSGTGAAAVHYALTGVAGGRTGLLHVYPSDMAQNFWGAIYAWSACFLLTIGVSLVTRPRASSELVGLVYSLTPRVREEGLAWYRRPLLLGVIVLALTIGLNVCFW